MPEPSASSDPRRTDTGLVQGQINASLFFQLAQFVVWGQQHSEVAAAHPELARLLETATAALSRGGIPDHENALARDNSARQSVPESKTLAQ
jgi:hypothetical protein